MFCRGMFSTSRSDMDSLVLLSSNKEEELAVNDSLVTGYENRDN
jgi:hypothetical protein